jgi:uncharacterized protein (DUF58 family)
VTGAPRAGAKLTGYAGLVAAGLIASLVLSRPELVALTAPFLLALAAGLALASPPRVDIGVELDDERLLEGDETTLRVVLASATPADRVDLYVRLPDGLDVVAGSNPTAVRLRARERRELELTLRASRFGGHVLGPAYARFGDPLGFVRWEGAAQGRPPLRVYPRERALRRVLEPRETQVFAGNTVARVKGEGIEFADLRAWAPGDAVRRVNWRASARRGELHVNELHPERNADVILFVDSFAEARLGGSGTLELAIRATATLAEAYLRRRDRVGLIGFGGVLRWLLPGSGVVQLYRIVDALLDTQIVLSYYWKEIDLIPRRTLPPNALVLALSPLLDERALRALLDLRARGFDLAVVEVSPVPFTRRPEAEVEAIAYDLWALRREALRHRLHRSGIPVAEWRDREALPAALEEVRAFRRRAPA